jgi:hypothetical protein
MALCDFVSESATSLAHERAPLSVREAYLAYVLQGMPYFRNVRRLDLWESDYRAVAPDGNPSETEQLLDELFELGRYNLYAAFSSEGTLECYERLRQKFASAGQDLPEAADLSNW